MSPASWYRSRLDDAPPKRRRRSSTSIGECWNCGHTYPTHDVHGRCGTKVCTCTRFIEAPPDPASRCSHCNHDAVSHAETNHRQRGRCMNWNCPCVEFVR